MPFRTQLIFWGLNHRLGCSPFGHQVYPDAPSLWVYDATTFGVGQETDSFRNLNFQSVALQSWRSRQKLDCGQFQQEPAISRLDRLFTPNPKLEEHLHVEPLQASTRFYPRFTLPRASSSGFGSHPRDLWHFHTTPLASCEAADVRFRYGFSSADYPCHKNALPGSLFETNATTPKCRSLL